MAAIIQYAFNTVGQWENAGLPKLINTASHITLLGRKITAYDGVDSEGIPIPIFGDKYYVECLFTDTGLIPDNGLLAQKAVEPIPHQFIGYPSLTEYEASKKPIE